MEIKDGSGKVQYLAVDGTGTKADPFLLKESNLTQALEISESGSTGVGVFVQDQTTNPLGLPFLRSLGTFELASAVAIDDRVFTASTGHGLNVGEVIEFFNIDHFMQARVLVVATDDITIDTPINSEYLTGVVYNRGSDNLLVDGSSTPVIFRVIPEAVQSGDMTRIIILLESAAAQAMDFDDFGSTGVLTNGIVLRKKLLDGHYINMFNVKSNTDLMLEGFDHIIGTKTTGAYFIARSSYAGQDKRGVAVRLLGSQLQEWQIVIQDNLTADNTKFTIRAQGHELQETM